MLVSLYEAKYGRENVEDILKQYVNKGYFIHFTDILKFGINPKSKFNTPLGIYAYPLNKEIFDLWKNKTLPYAQERKYIALFKPTIYSNIIYLDKNGNSKEFTEEDFNEFVRKYKDRISEYIIEENVGDIENNFLMNLYKYFDDLYQYYTDYISDVRKLNLINIIHNELYKNATNLFDIQRNLPNLKKKFGKEIFDIAYEIFGKPFEYYVDLLTKKSRHQTPFGKFWYLGYILTQNLVKWRKLLIENNIDGVVDLGSGIIHPNESIQAVFLNPRHLKLVETFDNESDFYPHYNEYPRNFKEFQYYLLKYDDRPFDFEKYFNESTIKKIYFAMIEREYIEEIIKHYKLYYLYNFIIYPFDKMNKKLSKEEAINKIRNIFTLNNVLKVLEKPTIILLGRRLTKKEKDIISDLYDKIIEKKELKKRKKEAIEKAYKKLKNRKVYPSQKIIDMFKY